ncbi:MAG: sigma-70 family RNA polymerase sigma factor, partial [Anaerolineales bacterium]|nr:sigma-70 family RNA polymerase sigma factor [Anaerolineales bacterium]
PIYRKFLEQVYYYLFARVGERHAAEDLTAQVFLEALEGLASYREDGKFTAWLFTIARRRAVDYHRQRKSEVRLQVAEEIKDPTQDVLANTLAAEDLHSLQHLVASLNEDERELLRLRYAAGLKFADMAILLKRKESAVKMNLYRLLARLKSQMEAENV